MNRRTKQYLCIAFLKKSKKEIPFENYLRIYFKNITTKIENENNKEYIIKKHAIKFKRYALQFFKSFPYETNF